MAKAQQDLNQTFTFIKGLVTEQPVLSGEPDSFSSGTNVLIGTDGICYKRLGLDYENGYGLIDVGVVPTGYAVSVGMWEGVNGDPNKNLVVIQVGTKLIFLDAAQPALTSSVFLSTDFGSLCLDVSKAQTSRSQFSSIAGGLIMVNPGTDPIHMEYTEDGLGVPELNMYKIVLKVRDFTGLPDGYKVNETPTTLTALHHYNLKNQGWVSSSDLSGIADETEVGGNTSGGGTAPTLPDKEYEPSGRL